MPPIYNAISSLRISTHTLRFQNSLSSPLGGVLREHLVCISLRFGLTTRHRIREITDYLTVGIVTN